MTTDEAKDIIIDTCKTPMQMDMAQITPGLEKWGFRVVDYERLSDTSVEVLQEYMVWLECSYGVDLMKQNVINWLEGLSDWPWRGHWTFVVKFYIANQPNAEWTFEIVRWAEGGWSTRKTDAVPKWPDRFSKRIYAKQSIRSRDQEEDSTTEAHADGAEELQRELREVRVEEGAER